METKSCIIKQKTKNTLKQSLETILHPFEIDHQKCKVHKIYLNTLI